MAERDGRLISPRFRREIALELRLKIAERTIAGGADA